MSWLLDDAQDRGEAVALLTASESTIYPRFGFGVAARAASHEIDADRAGFREPVDVGGRFTSLQPGEALDVVDTVWDRCRRRRVGELSRSRNRWEEHLRDPERERAGHSALFVVVHEGRDGPDGFVTYRMRNLWGTETHRLPETRAVVDDLCGRTPEIEAALWQFVACIDLVDVVQLPVRPVDDPVAWRLAEPRRLKVTSVTDWLWARVLDVPAALEARRYRAEGEMVVELVDTYRPAAAGRFQLTAGPDGAECKPAPDASADLVLGPTELGALYLGGVAPSVLAAAGRVDEQTPGVLARADLLFPVAPAPFCNTMF